MLSQRLVVLFWYQGRIVALAQGTWLARCNLMMGTASGNPAALFSSACQLPGELLAQIVNN
jgi:hypothetical protein